MKISDDGAADRPAAADARPGRAPSSPANMPKGQPDPTGTNPTGPKKNGVSGADSSAAEAGATAMPKVRPAEQGAAAKGAEDAAPDSATGKGTANAAQPTRPGAANDAAAAGSREPKPQGGAAPGGTDGAASMPKTAPGGVGALNNRGTKVAAGGAGVAGVQTAGPIVMLLQMLSMVQAALATAMSWVTGVVAMVQSLGVVAMAAVTAGTLGSLVAGAVLVGALSAPVDDGESGRCAARVDVKAALALTEDSESDKNMVANAKKVFAVMSGWGMPKENIAGILGNWEDESRITAAVVQGWKPLSEASNPSNGIGLGQWTGSRNTALRKYASARNMDWFTFEAQLEFMIKGDDAMYVNVVKKMVASSMGTPGEASAYYRAEWERNAAGTASDPGRSANAEKWFSLMSGWGSPEQYLTDALAALAQPLSGLLGQAADAASNVANSVAGWLGMNCPGAQSDAAVSDGEIPVWDGVVAPVFPGEARGRTRPVAQRAQQIIHALWPTYVSGYGGYSDRGAECSYSDHCKGLAVDFMIRGWDNDKGLANGWVIARFFQKNAKALGVTYVIWHKQKWANGVDNPTLEPSKWRDYQTPRGIHNPTNDHYNHVHVSFKEQ